MFRLHYLIFLNLYHLLCLMQIEHKLIRFSLCNLYYLSWQIGHLRDIHAKTFFALPWHKFIKELNSVVPYLHITHVVAGCHLAEVLNKQMIVRREQAKTSSLK